MHSQEFLDIGRHCKEPSCNVSRSLTSRQTDAVNEQRLG